MTEPLGDGQLPSDTSAPTEYPSRTANMTNKPQDFTSIWCECRARAGNISKPAQMPQKWSLNASFIHIYVAVFQTSHEMSSDNESLQAGGKVERLGSLEIIIMCKTLQRVCVCVHGGHSIYLEKSRVCSIIAKFSIHSFIVLWLYIALDGFKINTNH